MKDCVIISMALGLIAGALIVTNSKKAQELVDKGKNAVKKQLEKMS